MAEAICNRHFRSFDPSCIRCGEARHINEAQARAAHERARRAAEFASMALVPKEPDPQVSPPKPPPYP